MKIQQQNKTYNWDKRMTNLNANLELCQQKIFLKLFYLVQQLSRVFVLNVAHKKPEYIVWNVLIQNTYVYSQTGCFLASNIAILSDIIAILIGRLL
jgi:hypothetical protein